MLNLHHKHQQPFAFTLIELLVVVSIVILVSVMILPRLQQQNLRTRVSSGANQMRADLRNVRAWAQAVRNGTHDASSFNNQLVAYAFHADITPGQNSQYSIWEVWTNASGLLATYSQTPDTRRHYYALPDKVVVSSITPVNPDNSGTVDIYFQTPTGTPDTHYTTFDTNGRVVINLNLNNSYPQTVTISSNGVIF